MRRIGTVLLCVMMPGVSLAREEGPAASGADVVVLDGSGSLWRSFIGWRRPIVLTAEGRLRPLRQQRYFWMSAENPTGQPIPPLRSEPPPAGWQDVAFDDGEWHQGACPVGPAYRSKRVMMWTAGNPAQVGVICVRGKFRIRKPAAAAGLRIRVRYQGGAVLYLNGTEVKRTHLPAGELSLDTTAEPYNDDVYVRADGTLIEGAAGSRSTPEQRADYEKRVRSLEASLPANLVREGVNVLAVEVHRAPIKDLYRHPPKEYRNAVFRRWPIPWPHCRLLDVRLAAAPGTSVEPNVGRVQGIQVWQPGAWQTVTGFSFGDPCEALRPIRLVGIRNGVISGRVVVSSTRSFKGLRASVTDLIHENGADRIAASNVTVRYAVPNENRMDGLVEQAPDEVPVRPYRARRRGPERRAAIQPIWFTVSVLADAAPGTDAGAVAVGVEGTKTLNIPLTVTVHDWRLPDPRDLVTHNNLWQSHETLALTYKVPLWSDRHFELMRQGLNLSAPLANKVCMVPLICPSFCFGNTQSMVRWVGRAGSRDASSEVPNGFTYDFTVFDRYLDLYERALGKPAVLVVDVSHPVHSSRRPKDGSVAARVSRLDPETSVVEPMERSLKGEAQISAFWKPVLAQVRDRLRKRGWWDVTRIGTASDSGPTLAEAKAFKAIWPDRGWLFSGHPNTKSVGRGTAPVTCIEWVWGAGRVWDPDADSKGTFYPMPWKGTERVDLAFPRLGSGPCMLRQSFSLAEYRLNPEKTLQCGRQGIGRVGLDLWRFKVSGGRWRQLGVSGGQFTFNAGVAWLLARGPDGPVPSTRSEMFREGLQVREAMIYLQKALDADMVDADLAERIRNLLTRRARNMLRADGHRDWQRNEARLFALCAEVAHAIAGE